MQLKKSKLPVLIVAALGVSNAFGAGILFNATGSTDSSISYVNWNIPTNFVHIFNDYFRLSATCPGGSCVSATAADGTPLGNFGFGVSGNYFLDNIGDGHTYSGGSEQFLAFPLGSLGYAFAMNSATPGAPYLLQGTEIGFSVFVVGASAAVIEIDLTNATSQVISHLPSTVYLDVFGVTTAPITITDFTDATPDAKVIDPFTLDWTAALSDTSFVASPLTVPEPGTLFLVTGVGAVGYAARRRKQRT